MLIWSQEAFISALSLSLAHSLWQGALVGAVAVALHSPFKRATADVRYTACGLLLLTLVIAWFGSFAYLYAVEARATTAPVATAPFSAPSIMPAAASDPLSSDLQTRTPRSFAPSLVLLWALGVALLSLRHLSSLLALRHLQRVGTTPCPLEWQARIKSLAVRMGLRREVLVRLSPRIDVPLTFGVLKSYLLLPPSTLLGLSTEQLEALIAHELAHIRLHDSLVNMLQIYAETLLFFHPTVWWLSAQMRVAREQRCDDLAVRIVGDHALYARALLSMEELRAPIPHLALGATGGNSPMSNHHLIRRIQRVLGTHGQEKRTPWTAGVLALCTASIGLATLWPVHAHSAPTPRALHHAQAKQADGLQTVTTNTQIGISTNVNGKAIGVKFDPKTVDLAPGTPITIDGQQKRFGDLSDSEQEQLSMAVAVARIRAHSTNMQFGLGTSVNGKSIGLSVDSKTPDLTPDTPITVDGQPKRFGDLSDGEQEQLSVAVAAARVRAQRVSSPSAPHPAAAQRTDGKQTVTTTTQSIWSLGIDTSMSGKSIGLKIDSKTPDLTPETPITVDGQQKRFGDLTNDEQQQLSMIVAADRKWVAGHDHQVVAPTPETPVTVNGQPNLQKQVNEAVASSRNTSFSKIVGAKQSSTADNEQRRTTTAARQKVYQLKVGNGQVKVYGDTLKPDTIVSINGVRSRFKDLSADRQKQIRAAWSHDHRLPHL
jgi:beta-lactamase regulating signal transducer with metallopeptidase domain